MNLADYISELLGQYEEVNVPGLGYFTRERVNGYYNDKEARFYPPGHKAKFVPELRNDDTFALYVADKKHISLASSKYFTEKFISRLNEEAAKDKYLFSDLGWFQNDADRHLEFKPYDKIASDITYYGYAPVDIYKAGKEVFSEPKNPFFDETEPDPVDVPRYEEPFEEETYAEEKKRRPLMVWLIIAVVLIIIASAIFSVYTFYPDTFDKYNPLKQQPASKTNAVAPITDTVKKAVPANDTSSKADTIPASRFEVIAGEFRQKKYANAEITRFKSANVNAKIVSDAPGPLFKVTVGTYSTFQQADSARMALIHLGKINKHTKAPLEIKPKK